MRRHLLLLLSLSVLCACAPGLAMQALTTREKGALIGYAVGSGIGAAIGYAIGEPEIGLVAGGPIGTATGIAVANSRIQSRKVKELEERVARQQEEIELLREGMGRIGRDYWLEP